jgi:hypothetical protein
MKIFISHISHEAQLAVLLKKWIESTFTNQCEVFVSSDKECLPAGSKWLQIIEDALNSSAALLVLCSPHSLQKPWVNFETGCGWMKKVPIIPICHSGQKKGNLPFPISEFQALQIEDADFAHNLFTSLTQFLHLSNLSSIDYDMMTYEIGFALNSIDKGSVTTGLEYIYDADELWRRAVRMLEPITNGYRVYDTSSFLNSQNYENKVMEKLKWRSI